MQNSIVIDLGYGNSRLGQVVDWISSTFEYDIVARYNGGPQSGNLVKVKKDGKELSHEFQIFGSGVLRGFNTVLLPGVVFDPILLWKEYLELKGKTKMGLVKLIIDYHCPVITPYDVYINQNSTRNLSDGTSGKGVYVTKRREENHHHIQAIDLQYPDVLALKLQALKKAYEFPAKLANGSEYDVDLTEFLHCANEIVHTSNFIIRSVIANDDVDSNVIFESSAGLMLDENIGIFPHCTPSKLDIPDSHKIDNIYLVIKAYSTRHGNGPLTTEKTPVSLNKDISKEDTYQGALRSGILDLDVLFYALQSSNIQEYLYKHKESKLFLVFTHLDDIKSEWSYKHNGFISKFKDEKSFIKSILSEFITMSYTYDCRLIGTYISNGLYKEDIHEVNCDRNAKIKNGFSPPRTTLAPAPEQVIRRANQVLTEDIHELAEGLDLETSEMAMTAADFANHAISVNDGPSDIRNTIINERMRSESGSLRVVTDEYGRSVIVNEVIESMTQSETNTLLAREILQNSTANAQMDRGPEFDGAGNENPESRRGGWTPLQVRGEDADNQIGSWYDEDAPSRG